MDNLINLADENGNVFTYEVLDRVATLGSKYIAVMRYYENEEEYSEDDELLILEVKHDEEGEYFEFIRSDVTFNLVAKLFKKRLADYFEDIEI